MSTCDHYNYVKTKVYVESLKTCSQTCVYDPYDLYGNQAYRSYEDKKTGQILEDDAATKGLSPFIFYLDK